MIDSVLHKNPQLPNFRVIALCYFHTQILCGTYVCDYKKYQHETLQVDIP